MRQIHEDVVLEHVEFEVIVDKRAEMYLTKTLHVLEDVMLGVMANRVQKYLINTETCFTSGKMLHFRSSWISE